jgi:hypothetical protein
LPDNVFDGPRDRRRDVERVAAANTQIEPDED